MSTKSSSTTTAQPIAPDFLAKNNISHINLIRNPGIGAAVQTGYFKYALQNDYDISIQFDGDGQHRAKYIADLMVCIAANQADLIVGSLFEGKTDGYK